MGRIRDAVERAVMGFGTDRHGNPAGDRRAAGLGYVVSQAFADNGMPVAAAVASTLGAAAVAADTVIARPEPPQGGYAGFTTDSEKPKRRWRR